MAQRHQNNLDHANFFGGGLSLRTKQLAEGVVQAAVQLLIMSLLLAPLLIWACDLVWRHWQMEPGLRLGFIVLAASPTTITSCVVLTTAAKGNRVATLINASGGNLLG